MLGGNWKHSSFYKSGGKLPGVKSSRLPWQRGTSVLDRRSSPPNYLSTDNSSQGHIHSDHLLSERSEWNWVLGGFLPQWQVSLSLRQLSIPSTEINAIIKSEPFPLIFNNRAWVPGGFICFWVSFTYLPQKKYLIFDFYLFIYSCLRRAHLICNSFLVHSGVLANG